MPLILLALLILYFLFILVGSLAYIDRYRVTLAKLLKCMILAAVVPAGILAGKLLGHFGFPATVNLIGWLLWFFVPFILRLGIFTLVYLLRDRGREDALPDFRMNDGGPAADE